MEMPLLNSLLAIFSRHKEPAVKHGRTSPRLMMSEPVRFAPSGLGGPTHTGMLEDLSASGACIRTHHKMAPGEPLVVLMNFGQDLRFDLGARIVYARQEAHGFHFRYGVRFTALTEDELHRITAFIDSQKHGRETGLRAFSQDTNWA